MKGLKRIPSNSVRLVIADPPYAIGVKGAKWDAVSIRDNYMSWAKNWLTECKRVLVPGGAFLLYGSPVINLVARISVMLEDELGLNLVQHLNWVYTQGGDARMSNMVQYAVRHELLSWFEKPGDRCFNPEEVAEHYNDEDKAVALAKGVGRVTEESIDKGRPPRTFIDVPRENSRSKERQYGKHPSMKPLALCERLVKAHSNAGDTVVVPFAGSGSELVCTCSKAQYDLLMGVVSRNLAGGGDAASAPPPAAGGETELVERECEGGGSQEDLGVLFIRIDDDCPWTHKFTFTTRPPAPPEPSDPLEDGKFIDLEFPPDMTSIGETDSVLKSSHLIVGFVPLK